MPRTPILSREIFYEVSSSGRIRFLDFCIVDTVLGAMVEPRNLLGIQTGAVNTIDYHDSLNFNKMSQFNEDTFFQTFGSGGNQQSISFAS